MQCYCDHNWWHMDETCATPGAHWMHYPYACPTDYLYWPGRFTDEPEKYGPAIGFRVPSFLEHPDLPRAVKARRIYSLSAAEQMLSESTQPLTCVPDLSTCQMH